VIIESLALELLNATHQFCDCFFVCDFVLLHLLFDTLAVGLLVLSLLSDLLDGLLSLPGFFVALSSGLSAGKLLLLFLEICPGLFQLNHELIQSLLGLLDSRRLAFLLSIDSLLLVLAGFRFVLDCHLPDLLCQECTKLLDQFMSCPW